MLYIHYVYTKGKILTEGEKGEIHLKHDVGITNVPDTRCQHMDVQCLYAVSVG